MMADDPVSDAICYLNYRCFLDNLTSSVDPEEPNAQSVQDRRISATLSRRS